MVAEARGDVRPRQPARRVGPADRAADPAHPPAVLGQPDAEAPGRVLAEQPVGPGRLRRRHLPDRPLPKGAHAAEQAGVEARDAARGGVRVDRRHLRTAPGGRVDDVDVRQRGRVVEREPPRLVAAGQQLARPRAARICERRDARLLLRREPDVHVHLPRRGELVAEQRAERAPVDAPDDLAEQRPVEQRVLAVRASRRPPGGLGGEQRGRAVEVEQRLQPLGLAQREQAGLVAQHLAQRRVLLAAGGVLRPDVGDARVERDPAAVDQPQRARGGERLGDGENVDEAVATHAAAPQVRDRTPTGDRREGRSCLLAALEQRGERIPHRLEAAADLSSHLHPSRKLSGSGPRPTKPWRRPPDELLVRPCALVLPIAAVCATLAGWVVVRSDAPAAPDAAAPVVVGSVRVAAADLEATAARAAGARPRRLAFARRATADRAIERLWLQGEAAARGLRPARGLRDLRGQVADALAGSGPLAGAARLGAAFDAFHERWRARTRCLAAYRDPYEDRCGDVADATDACRGIDEDRCGDAAGAAAGTCRWMGEATLCAVRRRWLVVRPLRAPPGATRAAAARLPGRLARRLRSARGNVVRLRSRAAGLATARALYAVARAARLRARAAAAERTRADAAARERKQRLRDPRLSAAALTTARDACRRQLRESDPYIFGFGMQDVVGQAEGLIAARAALADTMASTPDPIDRGKLRPLVD